MEWSYRDSGIKGSGRDIIFAEDKFWFVHGEPAGISYSEDLINWEDCPLDSSKISFPKNLAYGNGKFIITGDANQLSNTYYAISDNGIDWEYKVLNTGQNFSMTSNSCRFLNNRFVFITGWYNYNIVTGIRNYTIIQIYETVDGNTVTKHEYRYNGSDNIDSMDISYSNGLYVMCGESGTILTSTNLNDWTKIQSPVKSKLVGITYGRDLFVITGANGIILTSQDGKNWEKQSTPTNSYLIRSRYGNGIFVAVGYNGIVLTSINGKDWEEEPDPFNSGTIYGLVFANNYYVLTANRLSSSGNVPIIFCQVTREVNYSSDESLYVFDKYLNFLGVIDSFISLRWRRKYYSAGEFELVVAPYPNNINLLSHKDNIIVREDYTEAALIDTIEFSDNGKEVQLHVSGNFLSYLLKRRIIKKVLQYKGNIIDGQKQLLREMTPLTSDFEIEPTTIPSEEVEFQCTYKNVYDYECNLSQIGNIGFRIVPNIENKIFRFENYAGLNRTRNQVLNERYSFSAKLNNCEKVNYIDTLIDKCNYVLVGGTGEGTNRILVEVKEGDAEGFDLFETFLDAKSESNNNLSTAEYKNVLTTKGKEKLKEETQQIEVTALSTDYKVKWDLGDIVDIDIDDWKITTQLRITEVEEVIENGTKSIYPTFGQPLAEKIELDN